MMQITRKSSPFRGPTVLLALMLGAGLVLSGCGDDDSTTTTPAPAPAPAPPAQPDPVSVPGGLTVSATGEDFIEFSWEAVEGASGYQIQMSQTEGDFSSAMMNTVTATMHRFTVAPSTTAYARVRATMDDRESDWSEAVMGMSMAASLTLGTPMPEVSSTGPDHIEWSWAAVENALAYQVRVADSSDGLEMATPEITTALTYRVTADAETTMYISVRAAAGPPASPVTGDWSDPVMGTSDVAPIPFVVSMTPPEAGADRACRGQAFCPDAEEDPETAKASVNTRMMVMSSHTAQVSPMFLDGAGRLGAIALDDGENTPFTHVDWSALQSVVANEGVTFMFRRVAAAAGQEPAATGDAIYITCGPFRCSEAMSEAPAAPDITIEDSVACTEFELDLRLEIGLGYNERNRDNATDLTGTLYDRNVGIDVGWTYTSSVSASVVHEFESVRGPAGGNLKVKGSNMVRTSGRIPLYMRRGTTDRTKEINYFGGVNKGTVEDSTEAGPIWNGTEDCLPLTAPTDDDRSLYGYDNINGTAGERFTMRRPAQCFRLITNGREEDDATTIRENHLPGYKVHVTPHASVTWAGSVVAWEKGTDPFDGLDCESVTVSAADEVADQLGSLCESYQEQVRDWWEDGIGSGRTQPFTFEYLVTSAFSAAGVRTVEPRLADNGTFTALTPVSAQKKFVRINVHADGPVRTETATSGEDGGDYFNRLAGVENLVHKAGFNRWPSLWLVDSTAVPAGTNPRSRDGSRPDSDMYRVTNGRGSRQGAYVGPYPSSGDDRDIREPHNEYRTVRPVFTVNLIDVDGDPIYGDFGKVDFDHNAPPSNRERGKADNFPEASNPDAWQCSDDDGTRCDSEQSFDGTITFTLYADTDDCTEEIDVAFTCNWDADGDEDRTGDAAGVDDKLFGARNIGNFVQCTAS